MITRRKAIKLGAGAGCSLMWQPTAMFGGDIKIAPEGLFAISEASPPTRTDINIRANVLLSQLSSGLDYYGMLQNYVPVLSVGYSKVIATDLASGGQNLSKALALLRADKNNKDKQVDVLNESINQLDQQLLKIQADQDQIPDFQKQLLSQIDQLVADQESARAEVISAVNTLNASLGGGCEIGEILTIASMLVSFATGIPPIVTSLIGAASGALKGTAFGPPDKSTDKAPSIFGKDFDVRVKDLQIVGGDIKQLRDAYEKAKDAFPPAVHGVDATKFLVQDGDFKALQSQVEASVNSPPDSPQKTAYVSAVNKYLSITQTRNMIVLAFDGLSYRLASALSSKTAAVESKAKVTDSLLMVSGDEAQTQSIISNVEVLIEGLLRDAHYWVLQYSRSIDFWTLNQQPPPGLQTDFDLIMGQINGLSNRIGTGKATQGVSRGALKERDVIHVTKDQAVGLSKSGKLTFYVSINESNLANKAQVLINSLGIEFRERSTFGTRRISKVGFTLTHNGYNRFRRQDGSLADFVTQPRTLRFEPNSAFVQGFSVTPDSNDPASITMAMEKSDYVGVSPFAQWTINVDSDTKSRLSDISELHVQFVGTGLALNP